MISQLFINYWVEVLFGILCSATAVWCKTLQNKLKQKQIEQDSLKAGMIAILHDRLLNACEKYLSLGYIPVDESAEALSNVKIIYEAYHGIGGNSTGTTVYNKFLELRIMN